ncbi:integrin beta-nu-like isoform X1 [Diorhabda sublineata]|uniref:integrin beta-nu-like isoform X1 n=2 Tax=Diorhabda sublineata TaxID=1163346 RepID=UPI0024E0834E|nr:integrin beta-nu-like isoform X1 [Diorhabda sublineata]
MESFENCFTTLIVILLLCNSIRCIDETECDNIEIQQLCLNQDTCDSCIQAHYCCHFCFDNKYTERKCNTKNNLLSLQCPIDKIEENFENTVEIVEDDPFSIITENANLEEIVQIKPQKMHLKLRKGAPFNLTFKYRPAENYPLDLYYLGDLSLSMSENMKIFKSLGKDLPRNLSQLTENYKLAYGTFVDKPGMPFYFTDKKSLENPCHNSGVSCEKGYLFKHWLDFTQDSEAFLKKVEASSLTANVDDLDGALDAILQILNCDERIGFSKSSRRIILLPTDSLLHSAGDGILVGAARKPTEECLLDDNGDLLNPLIYDYPTLQHIEMMLRQKKVNIIFAVKTRTKLYYYTNMTSQLLKGFAYVGELEEHSQNILELIKEGFYNFAETVSFYVNTTLHEYLDVQLFGDCENRGVFNATSICYGVTNDPVQFKIQITLKDLPSGKRNDVLEIEEKNINEKLQLSLEFIGNCQCAGYENLENKTCIHGDLRCGRCECENNWSGETCSEECNDFDTVNCRFFDKNGEGSKICNGKGECECGKCNCEPSYTGKYCEYQCPSRRINRELVICGGSSKGKCFEGKCLCHQGFTGEDCSCSTSQRDCVFEGMEICSGNGRCDCNKCSCFAGSIGDYCERNQNNTSNIVCERYEEEVAKVLMNNGTYHVENEYGVVQINDETDKGELTCNQKVDISMCQTSLYEGNSLCILEYCYYKSEQNQNTMIIAARKICTMTAGLKVIFSGALVVAAILILGVLLILAYKLRMYREERAEYKKFINANKNAVEMNPIYRSPLVEYTNPLRTKTD